MNIPTTLKQICEMRDRNWEALKGQEAHISRIIENAPQTQEDVEFVMKILVVALSEVMVRAQIELQVNKVLDSRGQ